MMRPPPSAQAVEETLRAALEEVAARLPAGAPRQIDRLSLRLPADASAAAVAEALERAIGDGARGPAAADRATNPAAAVPAARAVEPGS